MIVRIIPWSLLMASLIIPLAYSETVFKEVHETPAVRCAMALKTLFNGITLAGKRLVGVGQRGHIVYSDDQGKKWFQAYVPVSSDLLAVCFPTPLKGWAVGHDGVVLNSTDGGINWVKQFDGFQAAQVMAAYYDKPDPGCLVKDRQSIEDLRAEIKGFVEQGADKPFLDVWFENERTGFIVGAFNLIFRTADGGRSWKPWFDRTENPKRLHLYAIRQIGQELFLCGEQGLVLKLDRQKERFRKINIPYKGTFFGLTGKSGVLVVHGLRGNVFLGSSTGNSWRKIETGVIGGLTGSTVTEDGRIVLISQDGNLLISNDDGSSFKMVKLEQPFSPTAVVSLDKNTLILAGLQGIRKQTIK